jgi:hypothetical protein
MAIAAISPDARKVKVRNRLFRSSDGRSARRWRRFILWFDLEARRTVVPPPELGQLWLGLPRTDDFAMFPG